MLKRITDLEAELRMQPEQNPAYTRFGNLRSLQHRFESQVEQTPDRVGLVFERASLTYREINERANRLAHYLKGIGVRPEARVAIYIDRSFEMVIAILAVLKAGGAYVPIDRAYPRDRISHMLDDSQAGMIITRESLCEFLPETAARVICLDREEETISRQSHQNIECEIFPDSLAYIIYTSGSTGKPKGVLVTHSNVLRLYDETWPWLRFSGKDVWSLFHSHAFDVSVWEIFGALLYGGRLVVIPYWVSRSPEDFRKMLLDEEVTVLSQTPSAFQQLILAEEIAGKGQYLKLRLVIFAGEALDLQSLKPWIEKYGDKAPQLINMYGITETTVHSTYRRIMQADVLSRAGSVIGEAIPDLGIYILDDSLQEAPVGITGEIHVAGAGLARGYLNRADLTAERFIPDPLSNQPGGRLYRSGDLAQYLPDRDIIYIGRADRQIKVRGFRVELGEIESALKSHPQVRDAAVIAQEDINGKHISAYVVPRGGESFTANDLRTFLREELPEYMIPSAFMLLKELPMTPNGKLDRRGLPTVDQEQLTLAEDYVAPQTDVEEVLAGIYGQILGIDQVGSTDNFFAIGGDSIRSVQLVALSKERGLNFSTENVFEYQTVSELARAIESGEAATAHAVSTSPFSLISDEDRESLPDDVEDAYPLAMLQAGMVFHMNLTPDSTLYHNVISWHLRGSLYIDDFRRAVQKVVARHPILRTSFDLTHYSEPLQLVHKEAFLPVEEYDLRDNDFDTQQKILEQFLRAEKLRPFDLSQPPLLRLYIHQRTRESFQLVVVECHPIFDGWSLKSTLSEIFEFYFLLRKEEPLPVEPSLATTFRDFVALEREAINSPDCQHYWEEKLRDAYPIKLPRLFSRADVYPTPAIKREDFILPDDIFEGLKRLARQAAVPSKSVFLAAHLKVMSILSGQTDIMTGLVCNGRQESADGDRVRGLFLNTLPLRCELIKGSWLDLIEKAFEAERELLPFRRYPLASLQKKWGRQPLFEVSFNYVHFHAVQSVLRSGNVEALDYGNTDSTESNFTLAVAFSSSPISSKMAMILEYDTNQLCAEQIAQLSAYFMSAFRAMIEAPSARHDTACLLSHSEQEQILRQLNHTEADYSPEVCLQELFEAQAERMADATAIVFDDERLTYGEMNLRANRMAHYLRRRGLASEDMVGIYLDDPIAIVITILAVLKAGGAYVPLDSRYPEQRLTLMLEDSGAKFLVTEERLIKGAGKEHPGLVLLDRNQQCFAGESNQNPAQNVEPENLAYLIYTSGSTGEPKGVMIPHRGICNHLLWRQSAYPLKASDKFLQKASISFDISVWEIFGTLMAGAQLILTRPGGQQDLPYIIELIARHGITVAHFSPGLLQEFLNDDRVERCASLRRVFCGGEILTREVQEKFFAKLGAELCNQYGPTEASVDVTLWTCQANSDSNVLPIGRPIGNTQIYVLDPYFMPLPVGVAGELYVGGLSLARGYMNSADLTADKFRPDHYTQVPGARFYKTGDMVRFLNDGSLEFVGRNDNQVKIRGFRIELGEIESTLLRHPAIRSAVVCAQQNQSGHKRLVAYIVSDSQPGPQSGELRTYLRERLPDYMVPTSFVKIDALPLDSNGKVRRHALPAPERAAVNIDDDFIVPHTYLEKTIATIWEQVLGLDKVGANQNFFDLGGDSLLILQVYSKLREELGRDFSMIIMFQYPTISSLAKHLSQKEGEQPTSQKEIEIAEKQRNAFEKQRQAMRRIKQIYR